MRDIVYDISVSADGYICDLQGRHDSFRWQGDHFSAFLDRLPTYRTTIMGRATYDDVLSGLPTGENPYPFTDYHVISSTLDLPEDAAVDVIGVEDVAALRASDGGPIYLCGGGELAGTLARRRQIDVVRLKINPVRLGRGVGLWGRRPGAPTFGDPMAGARLTDQRTFSDGVVYREFRLT